MARSPEPESPAGTLGAVILAAGSGRRIGTPKLRLEAAGQSYLAIILDRLEQAEIAPVAVVVAPAEETWARNRLADTSRRPDPRPAVARSSIEELSLVVNPRPELGMFSSVQLGVTALRACRGLCIVPVDHPFVDLSTYLLLKQTFAQYPEAIIKPLYQNRPGHPVVLPQPLFAAVLAAAPGASLRELLRGADTGLIRIESGDAGILRNINEPGDRQG